MLFTLEQKRNRKGWNKKVSIICIPLWSASLILIDDQAQVFPVVYFIIPGIFPRVRNIFFSLLSSVKLVQFQDMRSNRNMKTQEKKNFLISYFSLTESGPSKLVLNLKNFLFPPFNYLHAENSSNPLTLSLLYSQITSHTPFSNTLAIKIKTSIKKKRLTVDGGTIKNVSILWSAKYPSRSPPFPGSTSNLSLSCSKVALVICTLLWKNKV